ncbi:MAG TPA: LuxR C-terminal-related transcriptional regulator [Flavitalea sp.]|nr:LuxR C-terminal-related transcriptional regulator [Flavitalea sp.]
MPDYLSLQRKSKTIITYLNNYLLQEPHTDINHVFSMMRTLQNVFPKWVLLSCPAQHPGFFFITDNCENVLGYTPADFSKMNNGSFLLSRVHEDDLDDMYRCFSFIETFLKETMPHDYIKLRFVLQYRFMHKRGQYITVHQEQAILPLPESMPLYYSIIRDITGDAVFGGVKLDIYKYDITLEKLAAYSPARENMRLSKREREIIELIQSGFSTKQIAHRLSISPYTARNIKQKMFGKFKVNNSISLLNKAACQ